MAEGLTVRQARTRVRQILIRAGIAEPTAAVESDLLCAHVLGVNRNQLWSVETLNDEQRQSLYLLASRRARREPLQHIVGSAPFRHLDLLVGPGVFVPRPETEVLVDHAIEAVERRRISPSSPRPRPVVVDLCAGSGAIGLSVAVEAASVAVWMVEVSPAALPWLEQNRAANSRAAAESGSMVAVVPGDAIGIDQTSLAHLVGTVDVITCNPPYIPRSARPRDPEVAAFDPSIALYGGEDGLAVVRPMLEAAARLLAPGGVLLVEHGDDQGWSAGPMGVPGVVDAHREFGEVQDHRDLSGRPRVTEARRR